MPSNEETTPTEENPYQSVVDEVWANRDVIKQARADLKAAKQANKDTLTEELQAVQDARTALSKVEHQLSERESAAHEARRNADRAASRAFAEAVGPDYAEETYF